MMSNTRLIVAPDAELDIREILHYTLITWGDEQVDAYWSIMWDGMQRIRAFPEIGRQRDHPGEREFPISHHIIIYRWEDEANLVTILRIRSQRQRRNR